VHEGGWTITGHPDHELHFHRPNGTTLRTRPPALRAEVRTRFADRLKPWDTS
jgi:hypothetical protein